MDEIDGEDAAGGGDEGHFAEGEGECREELLSELWDGGVSMILADRGGWCERGGWSMGGGALWCEEDGFGDGMND